MKKGLSSSGKVAFALTNHVAFLEKESVHADFHPVMDFLKNSPVNYALTASPTIYAEIVDEMWSKADCTTKGEIKFTIKGNNYILTPSVINEALHLPNSDFEKLPSDVEIVCMLKSINYASKPWMLGDISRRYLRKEWSYFFDTLTRAFSGRCSCYNMITILVQKIAYSLLYGRMIDIGTLLLEEFLTKLGDVGTRNKVVYYARFLMIIANHFCKDLDVEDKTDIVPLCLQKKVLFSHLLRDNFCGEVEFVLPEHIRVQLSTLSSSPAETSSLVVPSTIQDVREGHTTPTLVALPSSQSGSGKLVTPPAYINYKRRTKLSRSTEGNGKNETGIDVALPQKKKSAIEVGNAKSLLAVDPEMSAEETRDVVPPLQLPLSPEEQIPKHDRLFPLQHAHEDEDRQHLVNAASVLKSQLVGGLTRSGDKLRTEDMVNLANKCFNTLKGLGDDYTEFCSEVNNLISKHQELEIAATEKDNWNDLDINDHYIHQVQVLSEVKQKLSSAEVKLSTAENFTDSLKLQREEMKMELIKVTEELQKVEERVRTLQAERDQCEEVVEAEVKKLDSEEKEARVALETINDRYNIAKKEVERMTDQLLQLVRK